MDLFDSKKTKSSSVDLKIFDTVSQDDEVSTPMHILPQSSERKYFRSDSEMANISVFRKILAIVFTIFAVSAEEVVNFSFLRKSKCHIIWYWTESCVVTLAMGAFLCRANKLRPVSVSLWSLLPLGGLYTLYTAIDGSALNVFHNTSGGLTEIHQIGLAISPVAVMATLWWMSQKNFRDRLFLFFCLGCCVPLLILFSSEGDGYVRYYFSMKTTVLGVTYGCSLGILIVILGQHLKHAATSFTEVLFYLNCTCVVVLPVAFLLAGELSNISHDEILLKSFITFMASVVLLALFRLLHVAAILNQIAVTSPLVCIATVNASWIVSTILITFAFKIELLVSTFEAFFLVGLAFIVTLFSHLRRKASESAPS